MNIEKFDVDIPPDLEKFKVEVVAGLTLKQMITVIAMVVLASLLYFAIGSTPLVFMREVIIVIVCTPIILIGFFEFDGLSGWEFFKIILKFQAMNKLKLYRTYTVEEIMSFEETKEEKE